MKSKGSGKQRKMEETNCEVICGAQTIPTVKGLVKVKILLILFQGVTKDTTASRVSSKILVSFQECHLKFY